MVMALLNSSFFTNKLLLFFLLSVRHLFWQQDRPGCALWGMSVNRPMLTVVIYLFIYPFLQGDGEILVREVAERWKTIDYEVTCGLLPRVHRVYLGNDGSEVEM